MSLNEFIRLEAEAFSILENKDPSIPWRAIECGAAEKVRLFAESRNYMVSLDDLLQVFLMELCMNMPYENAIQYLE